MRARFIASARVYNSCVSIYARIFMKFEIMEFSVKGPDPPNQHPYWEKNMV